MCVITSGSADHMSFHLLLKICHQTFLYRVLNLSLYDPETHKIEEDVTFKTTQKIERSRIEFWKLEITIDSLDEVVLLVLLIDSILLE